MAISSIIVAIEDGAIEQVLPRLGAVPGVSVFGVKDNQIVTVVEAETLSAVNGIIKVASEFEGVIGIYPVYAGEHA
jgi:nitrate reductase NapAB chaperone NapD